MTILQILSLIFTFTEVMLPLAFITLAIKFALYPPKLESGKGFLRCDITARDEHTWKCAYNTASRRVGYYTIALCLMNSAKYLICAQAAANSATGVSPAYLNPLLSAVYCVAAVILLFTLKPAAKNKVVAKYGYPDQDDIDNPDLY